MRQLARLSRVCLCFCVLTLGCKGGGNDDGDLGGAGGRGGGAGAGGSGGSDVGVGGGGSGGVTADCESGSMRTCYGGPPGTANVGACTTGLETCNDQGTGWGACVGSVLPASEVPTPPGQTPIDEDCDGMIDES